MSQHTLEDWLTHAIAREEYARNYYQQAVEVVGDEGAKELLSKLAGEEAGHKKRLENVRDTGQYSKLGKGLKDPDHDFFGDHAFKTINVQSTPKEILEVAILNERSAALFYQWFIEVYAGTELEEFFTGLTNEEKRHAEMLMKLGEKL